MMRGLAGFAPCGGPESPGVSSKKLEKKILWGSGDFPLKNLQRLQGLQETGKGMGTGRAQAERLANGYIVSCGRCRSWQYARPLPSRGGPQRKRV